MTFMPCWQLPACQTFTSQDQVIQAVGPTAQAHPRSTEEKVGIVVLGLSELQLTRNLGCGMVAHVLSWALRLAVVGHSEGPRAAVYRLSPIRCGLGELEGGEVHWLLWGQLWGLLRGPRAVWCSILALIMRGQRPLIYPIYKNAIY